MSRDRLELALCCLFDLNLVIYNHNGDYDLPEFEQKAELYDEPSFSDDDFWYLHQQGLIDLVATTEYSAEYALTERGIELHNQYCAH